MKNQEAKENESSIAEIEQKIEQIKTLKNAKTKANVAEVKRLQSILNKVYIEYKRKLMNFEEGNFGNLALVRSTHGFYKMIGNSLYFYAFDIAPKLNLEARIYSDGDYEVKSDAGVISVRDIEVLAKALAKLKIKKVNTKDKTGNLIVFMLPWSYTKEELEKFVEQNTYKLGKYNHVIMVENTIPVLYLNLNELLKACYENVRRLEPVARETMGNFVVETVAEMVRIYIDMTNGRLDETVALKNIRMRLDVVKSQLKILADLKLWNARTYARIGEIVIKIQDVLDLQIKNGK